MKKYLMILGGFTGILFLFTVIPARFSAQPDHAAEYSAATPVTTLSAEESAAAPESEPDKAALCETYRMLDITSGKVEEISVRDYVIGAVCAEMPATFEPDALKAQAVAAHTYAERQHLLESASPTAALCGADFSNDSSQYQAYFTENQARQYYGDNFETAYAKVTQAVDDVLPYVLEYDGAPIIAAFCSMSAGVTESAENIWGSKVEYLVPVESQADTSAPRYLETAQFTGDEFQAAVQSLLPGAVWEEDMAKWVQIGVSSPSGTVLEVTAVGGIFRGGAGRQAGFHHQRLRSRRRHESVRRKRHGKGRRRLAGDPGALLSGGGTDRGTGRIVILSLLHKYFPQFFQHFNI